MELIGKEGRHWQTFSSVTDCLEFISLDKFIQTDSNTASGANPTHGPNPSDYYERRQFEETIKLMQDGWPEGRDKIEEFVAEVEKRVMGFLPVQEVTYSPVPGEWFDVGRYLTGEPEVYGQFSDTDQWQSRKGGRIIHVVLNIDVTWKPFERGAAGVAIIDALERCGYRVIADAVANTVAGGRLLETRIHVKKSDEPIQLDKLAFLFAHPYVLENVLFACWERLPKPIRQMYRFDQWYGSVGNVPKEDQGDIYVPIDAGYQGTLKDVADYVLNVLEQNGINIQKEDKA